ncbi:unnamed protein product [Spirodela intermedia]|uniref:Uncharacterized protein n=1 Tax=Spirodela intermedia TaxID=51605 RepID=A0A7I8IM16_SPIIN|nr:unnamed protein product [Spirodela intermedia]CAA6658001.1 unnamed protein product [Spirodela intermedia]
MPCRSDTYLLVALDKVTVLDNSSYSHIDNLFGLQLLVVSLIHVDFGPLGFNPPHTHRMAIESSVSLSSKTSSTSIS